MTEEDFRRRKNYKNNVKEAYISFLNSIEDQMYLLLENASTGLFYKEPYGLQILCDLFNYYEVEVMRKPYLIYKEIFNEINNKGTDIRIFPNTDKITFLAKEVLELKENAEKVLTETTIGLRFNDNFRRKVEKFTKRRNL